MSDKFYPSGKPAGFQYDKPMNPSRGRNDNPNLSRYSKGDDADADLIIEDNTIYEIDRGCFERLKRQKKRKD